MDGFDRIYDLHRILKKRKTAISTQAILQEMECSRATFNRVKRHMIDFLGAPIEYDRAHGGYRYVESAENGFELPGIWFNEQELHSLLFIHQLIDNLGVGLLKHEAYFLKKRVEKLIDRGHIARLATQDRIRFIGVAMRDVEAHQFQPIAEAILRARCLRITYTTRDEGLVSQREVSPQRLINYRNNWYLDAWCHKRDYYRTFAMECISSISKSTAPYKSVSCAEMDSYFQASYGIYAGDDIATATIRFSPDIARSIAKETWHPKQQGTLTEEGHYLLSLPFNRQHPQELVMDVARFGGKAEIISPDELRQQLVGWLRQAISVYRPSDV